MTKGAAASKLHQAAERLGLPEEALPRSVAIIMDGNGRWAQQHGLSRSEGHEAGARNVRSIVTEGASLGLEAMTLYSFSIENWKRPQEEVSALMHIYGAYLRSERGTLIDNNIRLRHFGRRAGLPEAVLTELDESVRATLDNTGMFLCLALNYGARAELVDAIQEIGRQVAGGGLEPASIDEALISASLNSAGVPDPDLLIRTAGEFRLSNFLLWQSSYTEFYVTDAYWPDFDVPRFHEALCAYAHRTRRFGSLHRP